MVVNILLTGLPKSGKTTLIKNIAFELKSPIAGFFTSQIMQNGDRVGFSLITFSGKSAILAHQNFPSVHKIGKYKVNLRDFEEIGIQEIEEAICSDKIIIIDEIGKMELLSPKFLEVVQKALDSKNKVLATVLYTEHPQLDKLKKRKDVELVTVTPENRGTLLEQISKKLDGGQD